MKLKSLLMLAIILGAVLIRQLAPAQGFVYLSATNTDGATFGTISLGHIDVLGLSITTGNNPGGYILDSFALLLATNSNVGDTITSLSLYDLASDGIANYMTGNEPNNSVSSTGGYDIFTPDSSGGDTSLLTPNTRYNFNFVCGGGINVSFANISPMGNDGWSVYYDPNEPPTGESWIFYIVATPVPEPSAFSLAGLAGLGVCWRLCWRK